MRLGLSAANTAATPDNLLNVGWPLTNNGGLLQSVLLVKGANTPSLLGFVDGSWH
jgi:hypothetical protein